ncbi:MAG: hypothetical protein QOH91_3091 [Mycobacterium sp.]|jgi:hypothetical protein|nr:hypothetical protein [Mycobacterium sp.]
MSIRALSSRLSTGKSMGKRLFIVIVASGSDRELARQFDGVSGHQPWRKTPTA